MKDGAETTFTIGTSQLKREDFYVLETAFRTYLNDKNDDFRSIQKIVEQKKYKWVNIKKAKDVEVGDILRNKEGGVELKVAEKGVGNNVKFTKEFVNKNGKTTKGAAITKNGTWQKKIKIKSLMARFEAFEGIDGLVPALPSIRIPERHEMM